MAIGGRWIAWLRICVAQAFKLPLARHDRDFAPRVGSFDRGCSGYATLPEKKKKTVN